MMAEVDKARNSGLKLLLSNKKKKTTQRALKQKRTKIRDRKIT